MVTTSPVIDGIALGIVVVGAILGTMDGCIVGADVMKTDSVSISAQSFATAFSKALIALSTSFVFFRVHCQSDVSIDSIIWIQKDLKNMTVNIVQRSMINFVEMYSDRKIWNRTIVMTILHKIVQFLLSI